MAELRSYSQSEPTPLRELTLFDVKTDAAAVNRGFFVQYLETVREWVKAYGTDRVIVCERYDDISFLDPETMMTHFKQIKSYWSIRVGINDEAVRHTLYLFYRNATLFGLDNCLFTLALNGEIRPKDNLVQSWVVLSKEPPSPSAALTFKVLAAALRTAVLAELKTRYGMLSRKRDSSSINQLWVREMLAFDEFDFNLFARRVKIEVTSTTSVPALVRDVSNLIEERLPTLLPPRVVLACALQSVMETAASSEPSEKNLTTDKLKTLISQDEGALCSHGRVLQLLRTFVDPILDEIRTDLERLSKRVESLEEQVHRPIQPNVLDKVIRRLTRFLNQNDVGTEAVGKMPGDTARKLTHNDLKGKVWDTVLECMRDFGQIDNFLRSGSLSPLTVRSIPGLFRHYYERRVSAGQHGNDIFWGLIEDVTSFNADLEERMTARVLVSYYFQACEVFENADSEQV
jgi:hypothetical protein